jgi:single-stranded DNA-binding protein
VVPTAWQRWEPFGEAAVAVRVNHFRGQAEHLADSLAKGDRVMVAGAAAPAQLGDP